MWSSFQKKDSKVAVCKLCLREVKYSGNTSNLTKHLKTNHKSAESVNRPTPTQPKSVKVMPKIISYPSTSSSASSSVAIHTEEVEMSVDGSQNVSVSVTAKETVKVRA